MRLPNFRKRGLSIARAFAIAGFISSGACATAETLDGFVTKVASRTDFYLSALHVVMDANTQCATENLVSDIAQLSEFILFDGLDSKSRKTVPCASVQLAVGNRVQIAGENTTSDESLLATQVTLYNVKIEQASLVPNSMNREWEGGALLEEAPQVSRTEKGFAGTVWLDGYPTAIAPGTELLAAPSGTELSYRPPGSHMKHPGVVEALHVPALKASRWDVVMPKGPVPPFTASFFQTNTWAMYQGGAPLDGQVPLESIRLWSNGVGEDERKYLAGLTPSVRDPDYAANVPGTIGFEGEDEPKSLEILADEKVQRYVTGLGSSLIPDFQRALPEQDKTKIHFRFYVVQGERPLKNDEMATYDGVRAWSQSRLDKGVLAFPNGVILVPDYTLARIGNEAQLAAILSDLITTVLQKQGYIARGAWSDPGLWHDLTDPCDYHSPAGCYDPLIVLPLLRNEQTLRVGIRQMYLAGYDIREAPVAWAAAAGKPTNPIPKTKKKPGVIPWYTEYAFDYIRQFYCDIDFSKLKRGEAEYAQFVEELRKADPAAFLKEK